MNSPSYSPVEIDEEINTLKHFYYPLSDEEKTSTSLYNQEHKKLATCRRSNSSDLDEFFAEEPPKKKKKICSSIVGRANKDGGTSYISTNTDDGASATHLVKIEVYELKKLRKIPVSQHWKYATTRIKYYGKSNNKNYENIKSVMYSITKEIAETTDCKKYSFQNND